MDTAAPNAIVISAADLTAGLTTYLRTRAEDVTTTDRPVYVELYAQATEDPIVRTAVRNLIGEGFLAVLWRSRHDNQAGVTFHPRPLPADSYRDRHVVLSALT